MLGRAGIDTNREQQLEDVKFWAGSKKTKRSKATDTVRSRKSESWT